MQSVYQLLCFVNASCFKCFADHSTPPGVTFSELNSLPMAVMARLESEKFISLDDLDSAVRTFSHSIDHVMEYRDKQPGDERVRALLSLFGALQS